MSSVDLLLEFFSNASLLFYFVHYLLPHLPEIRIINALLSGGGGGGNGSSYKREHRDNFSCFRGRQTLILPGPRIAAVPNIVNGRIVTAAAVATAVFLIK